MTIHKWSGLTRDCDFGPTKISRPSPFASHLVMASLSPSIHPPIHLSVYLYVCLSIHHPLPEVLSYASRHWLVGSLTH